ncbi:Crp/Fnr family transcriptional regulator [Aquimarina sp. U1-2]|uniref:Crp/Fnr family transcriptional regulator n=1 Tax=Aquimarina sp. U1-2 TaxID=2823141 RepID=UPI001AECAC7E|nr:Crp/Fnr family transcriptional regulator [Aquimarina sp. U1-2]MBP2833522.1 Crp/Fnr family transcriptional regulator [Aquimarina sp. U1-2]
MNTPKKYSINNPLYSFISLFSKDSKTINYFIKYWDLITPDKNKYLIKEGNFCNYLYFIEQGVVKKYYNSEKGEVITKIGIDNSFVGCLDSFFMQKTSMYNIKTIEKSIIRRLSFNDFSSMRDEHPDFNKIIIKIMESNFSKLESLVANLKKDSAKERYKALLSEEPTMFLKAPLKDIASFLRMSPETLSRIRSDF